MEVTITDEGTAVDLRCITEYSELLRLVEPRVVVSQEQAERYLDTIDSLTDVRGMSEGQREMVGLLAFLVHKWEDEHEEPITATPQEMVRHLLEENGLPQTALVPDVFPNRQNVSAFLHGRRPLTYNRAAKLATFFHLSPTAFYRAQRGQ